MVRTGEKPGTGTYTCRICRQQISLDDETDTMPPCSRCNHTEFD